MGAHPSQSGHNNTGMYVFIFCMVFTTVFFTYVTFFSGGVNLNEVNPDQPIEAAPGEAPVMAAEPKRMDNIASVKEPWISTPELIEHGHAVYNTSCKMCHGEKGLGDGPAAVGIKPRNLVEGKWKAKGDSLGLFETLQNGLPGTSMVSFASLPASDRWAMVHYIRSITQNKVPDNMDELKAKAPKLK